MRTEGVSVTSMDAGAESEGVGAALTVIEGVGTALTANEGVGAALEIGTIGAAEAYPILTLEPSNVSASNILFYCVRDKKMKTLQLGTRIP
jgi:hypothetical protein